MSRNHVTIQQPRIDGAGSFEMIIEASIDNYKAMLLRYRTKASETEKFAIIFGLTFTITQLFLRSIKYGAVIIIYLLTEINLNIISLLWVTFAIHAFNHDYMRRYLKRQAPLTSAELGIHQNDPVQEQPQVNIHDFHQNDPVQEQPQVNIHDFHQNNIFNMPEVDVDVADDATVHDN